MEPEPDAIDETGWGATISARAGRAKIRLRAYRPRAGFFTSLAFPIEVERVTYSLRRSEVAALAADADLALREPPSTTDTVIVEVSTRIWDAGLNRETFEATTTAFFNFADTLRSRLARPTG
jgi:hypothetical protein